MRKAIGERASESFRYGRTFTAAALCAVYVCIIAFPWGSSLGGLYESNCRVVIFDAFNLISMGLSRTRARCDLRRPCADIYRLLALG